MINNTSTDEAHYSSQTNYFKRVWHHSVTTQLGTPRAYGYTRLSLSLSRSLEHLRNALLRTYELTTDWSVTVYSGITLKWGYNNRTCDISMPGYVSNILSKFQHDSFKLPQHTPSRYVTPVYGAKTHYATKDETPPLTEQQCITIQKVTGSVLYYARSVDPTVLMSLNDIATEQTKATEKTQAVTNQILDYLATQP
jgi:hypothetical protein